ncbi:hypothetical protein [Pedobacter cryotolerans]|uniref:Lycopene cyclase domain-containing protein n=1 Tax=Pedobacter cryotolerans TaxID=2571270 RepID=A0A4U1BWD9_9SPHI|nr:hypothetical protein [Pedobacter cryotolerans]TKB97215.1 hypothetical protein FA045_16800 [Pedobacter cryotolerans]
MEPATPWVLFGYFDIFLLFLLITINIIIWKFNILKRVTWKISIPMVLLIFFFFPVMSTQVEVNNVYNHFKVVDGFNLLYIWFRWPTWWILGIIEMIVFVKIVRTKNKLTID